MELFGDLNWPFKVMLYFGTLWFLLSCLALGCSNGLSGIWAGKGNAILYIFTFPFFDNQSCIVCLPSILLHFVCQFPFSLVTGCVGLMFRLQAFFLWFWRWVKSCGGESKMCKTLCCLCLEKVWALLATETGAAICLWAFYRLLCEYFCPHKSHFLLWLVPRTSP